MCRLPVGLPHGWPGADCDLSYPTKFFVTQHHDGWQAGENLYLSPPPVYKHLCKHNSQHYFRSTPGLTITTHCVAEVILRNAVRSNRYWTTIKSCCLHSPAGLLARCRKWVWPDCWVLPVQVNNNIQHVSTICKLLFLLIYNLTQACSLHYFRFVSAILNRCTSTSPWPTPEPSVFRGGCNQLTVPPFLHVLCGIKSFYVHRHTLLISSLAETHNASRWKTVKNINLSSVRFWFVLTENKHLSAYIYIWRREMKLLCTIQCPE